jgi:hypothetical protein
MKSMTTAKCAGLQRRIFDLGLVIAVLACGVASAAEGDSKPKPPTFKSPEECFAAFAKAMSTKDFQQLVASQTDASNRFQSGIIAYMLESKSFESLETRDAVFEIQQKHGLDVVSSAGLVVYFRGRKEGSTYAFNMIGGLVADHPAFLADATKVVSPPDFPENAKLADVKIDGDKATAKMIVGDSDTGEVHFRRIDNSWRMASGPEELPPPPKYTRNQRIAIKALRNVGMLEHYGAFDGTPLKRFRIAPDGSPKEFTDETLAPIQHLSTLPEVHLDNTAVTDAGLAHLKPLSELTILSLAGTKVTDEGVATLARHAKLTTLDLRNTATSAATIKELRRKLPDLKVEFGAHIMWLPLFFKPDQLAEYAREGDCIFLFLNNGESERCRKLIDETLHTPEVVAALAAVDASAIVVDTAVGGKPPPWFSDKPAPQIAVFMPGDAEPKLLEGDISQKQVLDLLEQAAAAKRKLDP